MQEAQGGTSLGEQPMSIISIIVAKRCFNNWHNHTIYRWTFRTHRVGHLGTSCYLEPHCRWWQDWKHGCYATFNEATTMATYDSRVTFILQQP